MAVNVLQGRGFAIGWDPPFCATAVRTPLYPLFLIGTYLALGRDPQAAVLVQILLEVLTTAWVVLLARAVSPTLGPPYGSAGQGFRSWIPFVAGLLYALNGTTQRYTGYLLSEALLLPVQMAALWATVRLFRRPTPARAAWAAVGWGLALLIKPNVQYLVVAVLALVILRLATGRTRRGWRIGAAFLATLAVVLLPWVLRNRLVLGRWVLSTAFEENLARVSAVATEAELQGLDVAPWTETWEYIYGELASASSPAGTTAGEPLCDVRSQQQRDVAAAARALVFQHLGTYLRVHARGVLRSLIDPGHRLWYHVATGREWLETGVVPDIWERMAWSLRRDAVGDALHAFWTERISRIPPGAAVLWWGLLLGRIGVATLAARGAWRLRPRPWIDLLLLGTVLYYVALPGPIAYDRFYVPVVPVVCVFVAWGAGGYNGGHRHPLPDTTCLGGHYD